MKICRLIPASFASLLLLPAALGHSRLDTVSAHQKADESIIEVVSAQQKPKPSPAKSKAGAPALAAEVDNGLDSPDRWPTQVPAPKNTRLREVKKKGDKEAGLSRYQTINFQFTSEVPLSEEAQESVGRLFETAYAAVVAMSKSLPIERATRKRPANNKFRGELYKTMDSYYAAGGPTGSAGVFKYSSRRVKGRLKEDDILEDKVMVPFDHLGFNVDGTVGKTDIDSHTLVHEITHQFTCLNNLPVWANEGFSEYVGYIPYDDGVLDFDKSFAKVVDNGKRRQRGGEIAYPFSLEDFFLMEKDTMYGYMDQRVDTYFLSLLCVTYFVHMGEEAGVRAFKNYLKDLLKGKKNDKKLLKKLYARKRTAEAVEKDFIEAWAKQGVNVSFAKSKDSKDSKRSRR